jgi:Domain of unknown function (DUF4926)
VVFDEHDVVRLKQTTAAIPLAAGSVGTVVHVYDANPPVYLVEFGDGVHTVHLYDAHGADLEKADQSRKDPQKNG